MSDAYVHIGCMRGVWVTQAVSEAAKEDAERQQAAGDAGAEEEEDVLFFACDSDADPGLAAQLREHVGVKPGQVSE